MVGQQPTETRATIERWNRVFSALGAEPRRQIVLSLRAAAPDRSLPLPEAANPAAVPLDLETLLLRLRHTHLPLLADEGFVAWQRTPFTVSRGPNFESVAAVLEAIEQRAHAVPSPLRQGCLWLDDPS